MLTGNYMPRSLFLFLSFISFSATSAHNTLSPNKEILKEPLSSPCHLVTSLSIGPAWAKNGNSETFYLTPEIEKSYLANKETNILADGELFLGMQKSLTGEWLGQLGLAFAAAGNAKFQGEIWDDALPQFYNYDYSYKVSHAHVAVKGKLLVDKGYDILPWISASLGVGFNRAHDFHNTPLISEAVQNPNFAANTETTFTYTLGAGLQKIVSNNWQFGLGYEFADWGRSELGRACGQTLNKGLSNSHIYTNALLFNITYLT